MRVRGGGGSEEMFTNSGPRGGVGEGAGEWGASFRTLNISLEDTCQKTNTKLHLTSTIFPTEISGFQAKVLLLLLKKQTMIKKPMPTVRRSRSLSSHI